MADSIPHIIVDPKGEPEEPAEIEPWPKIDPPTPTPRDPRLDRPYEPHPWGQH